MGLVATQPVGHVEQNVTNQTYIIEVLEVETSVLGLDVSTITQSCIVAGPGSAFELLKVNTTTQTQQRREPFTNNQISLGAQALTKL